jgi:hypothetical protein
MANKRSLEGYRDNVNLKPYGVNIDFTPDQVKEYVKCAADPIYFSTRYMKAVSLDEGLIPYHPYPYQKKMIETCRDNRFVICKLPRQSGKTLTMCAYLLWNVLFNQDINVAVLANKKTIAYEILERIKNAYQYIPKWLQQGVKEWNKGSIVLENGSRIIASATSSSAVRGLSLNIIYLDEFAHIPNNIAEDFFSSVYPTISAGKDTKVIITSTPRGLNKFYHLWKGATKKPGEEGKNEFAPIEVSWRDVPKYPGGPLRDDKWMTETIANTSLEQFNQEYNTEFLGSTNTLIASWKLSSMNWSKPIKIHKDGLAIFEEPKPDHIYALTVDVARGIGKDYSAFTIIDCTNSPYKLVAKFRNNLIPPLVFPNIIEAIARTYNNAWVLVEVNDVGGQVVDILHTELEYENIVSTIAKGRKGQVVSGGFGRGNKLQGVRTTVALKKTGCSILKNLVEQDRLIIEDRDILDELMTFVSHGEQGWKAEDGHTDDLVMCLVLFSWLCRQQYFKDMTSVDIRKGMMQEEIEEIENEFTPFGFSSADFAQETEIQDGEDHWKAAGR